MAIRVLPFSQRALDLAIEILTQGGIVAHATETCYGLACDLTNAAAVGRLFAIKKRLPDQPVSALFSDLDAVKQYVQWTGEAEKLAQQYLPGPLTLILRLRPDAPAKLYPTPLGGETIGIRVSSCAPAMELVRKFGKPVSTTSANVHRQPSSYGKEEILSQFSREFLQPDIIINSGPLPITPPSTVMDLTEKGKRNTLRKGMI